MSILLERLEMLDRHLKRESDLSSQNGKLRRALRECWKLAKHSECGEKITGIVIAALADQDQRTHP